VTFYSDFSYGAGDGIQSPPSSDNGQRTALHVASPGTTIFLAWHGRGTLVVTPRTIVVEENLVYAHSPPSIPGAEMTWD